jgi:small conductance mechanosensitive channel
VRTAIPTALSAADVGDWALDRPLRIALILIGAWVAVLLSKRAIKLGLRRVSKAQIRQRVEASGLAPEALLETREQIADRSAQRVEAISTVLGGAAAFAIWTIAAFLVLSEVEIDIAPLLAGAGIAGIALGFGAQSLVRDFLSGIFILIEDQFAVGDIVDVGEATGVVEGISLRTTRLRSVDGTVWHVPNGEILRVGNMSQHWSRALLDIEVAYATDIERAKATIKRVADDFAATDDDVLDDPEVWGVEMLGVSGITIRLVVKTTPSEQWRVMRELRERIKDAFDAEGIEIPFPQQTVWMRPDPGAPAARGPGGRAPGAGAVPERAGGAPEEAGGAPEEAGNEQADPPSAGEPR